MTSQEEQKQSYFRKIKGLPGLCHVTKEVVNDDGTVSMWGMKKPNELAIEIYDHYPITSFSVEYGQTGTDSSKTVCTLNGSIVCDLEELRKVADFGPTWNSVLTLKEIHCSEVVTWKKLLEEDKEEWETYLRLKKRFEE